MTERQRLIKKCDELFSKLIRQHGKCEKCGKTDTLQTAHIISRKYYSLRWEFDNALCLCYRCHIHFAHKEPLEFTAWLREYKGNAFVDRLLIIKQIPFKTSVSNLKILKIQLENAL